MSHSKPNPNPVKLIQDQCQLQPQQQVDATNIHLNDHFQRGLADCSLDFHSIQHRTFGGKQHEIITDRMPSNQQQQYTVIV